MEPLSPGADAPPVPGAPNSAHAVVFYKVTCPTCRQAAPPMERLHRSAPDRLVAVVQDPAEAAAGFNEDLGTTFEPTPDTEPYELSNAYGVRTVPTVFVVDDGTVRDVVESWDRDGWNRLGAKLSMLVGRDSEPLSWEGDGLPPFRPG